MPSASADRAAYAADPLRRERIRNHGKAFTDQLQEHEDAETREAYRMKSSWLLRQLVGRWFVPRAEFDELKHRVDELGLERYEPSPSPDGSRLRLLNRRELRLFGVDENWIAYIRVDKDGVANAILKPWDILVLRKLDDGE